MKLGNKPLSLAWTYFSPELTPKEVELVEKKDQEYMRSFKMLNNADVNEPEMKLSSSSSKYVSAYCRRRTIAIDSQNLLDANQESNSTNEENSTPSIDLNVKKSSEEEKSLLGQDELAGKMSFLGKEKLYVILLMIVAVGLVGLSIPFTKDGASTTSSSTTQSIPFPTLTSITKKKDQGVNEAVLMLSTRRPGNVPMVITSTGESHFEFFLRTEINII